MSCSYTQAEIDNGNDVGEMPSLAAFTRPRSQALGAIYIYLCVGAAASWYSPFLQSKRTQESSTLNSYFDTSSRHGSRALVRLREPAPEE